jgi:hypothetical protein
MDVAKEKKSHNMLCSMLNLKLKKTNLISVFIGCEEDVNISK